MSVQVEISAAGMNLTGTVVVIMATADLMTTHASVFDDVLEGSMAVRESSGGGGLVRLKDKLGAGPRSDGILVVVVVTCVSAVFSSLVGVLQVLETAVLLSMG